MPNHFDKPQTFVVDTYHADTIAEETSGAGVTVDGVLLKDSEVTTDVINEKTSAAGVTADGVKLKDSEVYTDVINEKTSAAGVTADGVKLKDSQVYTDQINEKTSNAGVTIDGALLKDGRSNLGRQVQALTASGAISIKSGLVTLAHATVVIAATLAAPVAGDELLIVDASASGTAAHTVTLPAGVTFDGTNNTATLDAPNEALHMVALSATRWFIIDNIGSVGLSTV